MSDPLKLTLGELLERITTPAATELDPWVDARESPVPWRAVVAAAQRGELEASRVGRKVLVRRSELDRFLAARRIQPRAPKATPKPQPASRVAHILTGAGYSKKAGAA